VPTRSETRPDVAIGEAIRRAVGALSVERMEFADFARKAWHVIEPATDLEWNWHIDLLCDHLEALYLGRATRLAVNMPPRTIKSIFCSVLWPCWLWTRRPWTRFIFSSYSQDLATEFSVKRRRVITSEWYQARWGAIVRLQDDKDLKTEFENTQTGVMSTTSTGGTVTGKGADVIVIDDPQNPKMAESEPLRKQANDHYSNTLVTRLNDKKRGVILLTQQRLHVDDNTGRALSEGGWNHLEVPAFFERLRTYLGPVSKRRFERKAGTFLQPSREGRAEFDKMRRAMGSRAHDAQYQQKPSSETGNVWKRRWWQFYTELPGGFDLQLQSWDLTFKKTKAGSYIVGQVWGLRGSQKYLLDQMRFRGDYPESKRAIRSLTLKWPMAAAKLVEDKANGPALIADLRSTISGIVAVEPVGDKSVRAHAVAPTIEAGDVWLPHPDICPVDPDSGSGRPWVEDYLEECSAFPEAPQDDQVDCTSQALVRLNELALGIQVERAEPERGVREGDPDEDEGLGPGGVFEDD
jgi:predicted phage terminase large subunit-like protein